MAEEDKISYITLTGYTSKAYVDLTTGKDRAEKKGDRMQRKYIVRNTVTGVACFNAHRFWTLKGAIRKVNRTRFNTWMAVYEILPSEPIPDDAVLVPIRPNVDALFDGGLGY